MTKKGRTLVFIAGINEKVRNRHTKEAGVVDAVSVNSAGNWYYVVTASGMSIGWWHETDIALHPKSVAPSSKRQEEQGA